MACVDAPRLLCGFCIYPHPPIQALSYSLAKKKQQQKKQLFVILVQAFLQVSVVLTVLCAPSSTLSILTYLPVSILSFSPTACLFSICEGLSCYLSTYLLFLPSLSLAVSPSS